MHYLFILSSKGAYFFCCIVVISILGRGISFSSKELPTSITHRNKAVDIDLGSQMQIDVNFLQKLSDHL